MIGLLFDEMLGKATEEVSGIRAASEMVSKCVCAGLEPVSISGKVSGVLLYFVAADCSRRAVMILPDPDSGSMVVRAYRFTTPEA